MRNIGKYIFLILFLTTGMVTASWAQTIKGNVYGGGEMAQVTGSTYVTINKGSLGADIFGGGEGKLNGNVVSMSADVSGDTHVTINGGEFAVEAGTDGKPYAEHYNIYGGGNIASAVGNTHLYVTKGMISNASAGGSDFLDNDNVNGIAKAYYNEGQMYFCIFGGGYGKNTSVTGNTWVDFNIDGMEDINSTAIEDDLLEYQSYLDVVGGGFNGTVLGNTNVHVGGNAMCRDVYGGGLYATIGTQNDAEKGKTNVHITGGNIDNVYGGGVMGDILTSTNVTIGLHGALNFDGRDYAVENDKVTILMSVFGGNDVSGRVETANIYHYGGTVDQDIYGAGNGNYRGYYTPNVCDYADGDNDNYYAVDHSGDTSTDGKGTKGPKGNTYKGRPQTGNVNITIAGNSTSDKASVLGQVFGGGNSCTIGNWVTPFGGDKYSGDPHKWRDDPEYFLGGGSVNVTLGSHVKIGRSHKELVDANDEEYLNKDGENVSGLFMGCSGKYLATQETAEDDYVYHHFYDAYTAKYWPGFAVFDNSGNPLSRAEGLASFNAYLNNILVWSDNVHLNIANDAEDIWLANFVGGGFRGSMKAKTASGRFAYTLPEGVTIGNAVVGGAYNTDVVYRVFDTENDMHTYKTTTIDGETHYLYRTDVKAGWNEGEDYHHVERDGEGNITGIVRFYYDGGMLAENDGNRIHKVHADPRTSAAEYATAYFEPLTEGDNMENEATKAKLFTNNRDKAFVYLNLRCALEPEVLPTLARASEHSIHGGNVFGGCFMSGLVQGDSWVDYGAWLSPVCANSTDPDMKHYFDKTNNMNVYDEAADLENNNALNVFGAGYGEDTHTAGDTYLYVKAVAQVAGGDGNKNGKFPYMFNAFGGSFAGRVYGNTNVYYASGKQGTLLGSLYGGGFLGDIDGNTFVELAEGFVKNVYGGSRQANIGGASHVWAYDGKSRGIDDANHLIICNLYGGNDIAGTIGGTMPAAFAATKWNEISGKQFNSHVEISADDDSSNRGFPLIGSAYAGGNGENWAEELGEQPTVETALIEIDGGSTLRAFGGGNMATVTEGTYIFTNASSTNFASVTFSEYQTNIMKKVFFNGVNTGYTWDGTTLNMDPFHVANLFGGNNLATMDIQPVWNLKKGKIENVYSGGNMGDMTYYNAAGGTTGHETESKGLSITIDSDDIHIESLYGGCRMSDVIAMDGVTPVVFGEEDYGATVNIRAGYINNVYGGNDVSGTVANGTNVNITGAVSGNVYGSGNGNYYYVWDKETEKVEEVYVEDGKNSYSYYKVPKYYGGDDANDAEKILTINHWRPSVNKAYLNVSGTEEKVAYVKGNVYCGGNASTVEGDNAHTKFNIGSYVTLNGVFMGSDGKEFSTTENIRRFEKLNGFDMTNDVEWPASWKDKDGAACVAAVADEDKRFYPSMLSLYMKAVEMDALPQGYQDALDVERTNAYIGTFCGGGNRGSMTIGETVNMILPSNITIYDKVVAGCLDANLTYKNGTKEVTNVGGYYRPMSGGRTKLNYTVECQFKPLVMDVPDDLSSNNKHGENFEEAVAKNFLYDNYGTAKVRNTDVDVYNVGCNIYGGCYHSGDVLGDVVLNVKSAMLAEPLRSVEKRARLKNTIKAEVAAFNVYGAGFDLESHVYGNVTITLDNTPNVGNLPTFDKLTCPSASNINGGGRSGYLYGNSYINILNGIVYNNVIGGSDAGYQYGSTHIAVGDPVMYECNTQGEYTLDRADKWNEDKVNHDGTKPVTTSVKLMVGDRVSEAVYNKIPDSDHSKFTACYVPSSEEASRLNWTNRKIHIGAGVYAGGYALATGSAVYAGDYTVRKLTTENRWKNALTGAASGTIGYAGNANIMIADDPANATSGNTDHITISTIEARVKSGMKSKMGYFTRTDTHTTDALGDPIYSYDHQSDGAPAGGTTYYELSGEGGIYGDGHLSFVEGFRSADIQRYGYAEHVPQDPKLLNTMQRLDFVRVQDCCLMLQGATDFAINANSGTVYSIARVRELYLESNINPTAKLDPGTANSDAASADRRHEVRRSRNYLGFFNNVHYIGAIATNDEFSTEKYHDQNGAYVGAKTYQENKQGYITADYNEGTHEVLEGEDHYNHFKQRNIGTARNMIGINNGYTLKVQNVYTTATVRDDGSFTDVQDHIYYGPIVGVAEVKLLTLVVGEGGGYVYADNVHSNGSHFMNTSGNFVFPGTVDPLNPQYVVDDCFPKNFAGTTTSSPHQATEAHDAERPAHYWYVMGNKYFFTNTITGYTFGDEEFTGEKNMQFDMDNLDQIITLSGTKKGDVVRIKNVTWEHPHGSHYTETGQSCDIADTEKGYSLHLSASTSDKYNTDGGYTELPRTDRVAEASLTYAAGPDNGQESPLLAIRLNDSEVNNTANYWRDHLSDPCRVTFELESGTGDPSNIYTYYITLDIVYVQGPRVSGKMQIENCAMPGELIHAEGKNLSIETDEAMPVTGTEWRLVNPVGDANDPGKYVYVASYNRYIDHSKADLLARYRYNGWGLEYVVQTSVASFPVSLDPESPFGSLLVHNYHDMAHVDEMKGDLKDKLDPQAGARIYIKDKAGWDAFIAYLNAATNGNTYGIPEGMAGIKVYLQSDITLDAVPAISVPFKGELNGDGYSVSIPSGSLFGSNVAAGAKVYNLGLIGGNSITTVENVTENCFVKGTNDDFLYGKKAYELSHNYKTTDADDGYINGNRYAKGAEIETDVYEAGDWQYARINSSDDRMLRTGEPYYGSAETRHNTEHTAAEIEAHDCLFFGQELTPTALKKYPEHIDDSKSLSTWTETNRVWGASGYYRSKDDNGYYYNKEAWVLNPTTTAISFIGNTKDEPDALASFNVADDVTRNLLVYESSKDDINSVFAEGVYDENKDEAAIIFHSIANNKTIANLHLVDKEDFNCPLEFTATKAWYVRNPGDETGYVEAPGTAWESICLPFSPSTATLSEGIERYQDAYGNGATGTQTDITFFFGADPAAAGGDAAGHVSNKADNVGHEYWLRQLTEVKNEDAETRAYFQRPASNTFAAYTPYIVSFPGERFYEFDMTGQTITFSGDDAVVGVTDDATLTATANGYGYTGAFLNENGDAGKYAIEIGGNGDKFEHDNPIYPFRGYLAATASPAKGGIVFIGGVVDSLGDFDDDQPELGEDEDMLKIMANGRVVTIISGSERQLGCYAIDGTNVGLLNVREGVNRFTMPHAGIYIIDKTKIVVK